MLVNTNLKSQIISPIILRKKGGVFERKGGALLFKNPQP